MTVPDDAEKVLTAIRLGWAVAEARGRNRPDAPPGAKAALPGPPSGALPLRVEQTPTELRIEVQSLLGVMAHDLRLDRGKDQTDFPRAIDDQAKRLYEARKAAAGAGIATASGEAGAAVSGDAGPGDAGPGGALAARGPAVAGVATSDGATQDAAGPVVMVAAGETPAATAVPGDPAAEWLSLQELIFKFDQHIQNTLAWGADTVAGGYQLGRALAEPYWALDPGLPDQTPSPAAWWFLLGQERCGEMSRLAGRLTAYFHPLTAAAIAGSVQIWKHVAADPVWRENAEDELFLQVRRWYGLVVMTQDPTILVQPYVMVRNFRMVFRTLRIFWPELIGAAVAAAALSGFAVALGQNHISSFAKSALGFIAITGFSIAGVMAKLKSQAQVMVTRLRQDVYTDLVAVAITTAPPVPSVPNRPGKQNAKKAEMARERNITPVTPN
jgi:uncharacterized protein (DUF697 family)